jgi:hypothetical protein
MIVFRECWEDGMGFGRRLVRKAVRKATPRSVRRAMHPVRTVKHAITPRPVKQISRAVYTVTNPLGAIENKLIGAALGGRGRGRRQKNASTRIEVARTAIWPTSPVYANAREAESMMSTNTLASLMAVQRQRFAPSARPVVPDPPPVDATPFRYAEWERRRNEARFWQRGKRRQIRDEVERFAQASAEYEYARLKAVQREHQANADAWWSALSQGESATLTAALNAAFADNPAPVTVVNASGSSAVLIVHLPGIGVLPSKKPYVTPTGRPSAKAWTKTELNEVYAALLAAHLLATIREAWAIGCSLTQLRVIGAATTPTALPAVLFDVDVNRDRGQWLNDDYGLTVLAESSHGLHRVGRTRETQPWPEGQCREDIRRLMQRS